jgi:hypothetical protein
MKKLLLVASLLSLAACSKHDPGASPAPGPPVASGYAAITGALSIKSVSGSPYTVSGLKVKVAAIQPSTSSPALYTQYIFRGVSSAGDNAQVEMLLSSPNPVSSVAGPWSQETTVYSTSDSYTSLRLIGSGSGTLTNTSQGYTATFTGSVVSGALIQ